MCIAIFKTKGTPLPENFKEQCKQSYNSNRNGMGLGLWKNGEKRLFVSKGFFDFDVFWKKFESLDVQTEDALLVHARISTHGEVNDLNCHPFVISKKQEECCMVEGYTNKPIMIHNGVFYKYGDKQSKFSDTFHFANRYLTLPGVRDILKYFPEKFAQTTKDLILIKGKVAIDVPNDFGSQKVAILYPNGKILHFGTFLKDGEMMYSNTGYKSYTVNRRGYEYIAHRDLDDYMNSYPSAPKKVTPTAVSSGIIGGTKLLKSGAKEDALLIKSILTCSEEVTNKYILIAKHDLESNIEIVNKIKTGTLLIPKFYNGITQQTTICTTLDGNTTMYPTQLLIMQTDNLIPWKFNDDNVMKKMNNIWASHTIMDCEKNDDKYIMLKKHGLYEKKFLLSLLFGWKYKHFQDKLLRIGGIERSKKALVKNKSPKMAWALENSKNKLCKLTMPMSKLEDGMVSVRAFTIDESVPVYTPVIIHLMDLIVEKDKVEEKYLLSTLKDTNKELVN